MKRTVIEQRLDPAANPQEMTEPAAAPLSLKDRIKQLEQAAQAPLIPSTASLRPTSSSTGVTPPASSTRLSGQRVEQQDDPLQSGRAKQPYAATGSSAALATEAGPPSKPPRPVWVSKAKGISLAQRSETTGKEADSVSAERTEPLRDDNQADAAARLADDRTLARSSVPTELPKTSESKAHGTSEAGLNANTSAPKPNLPSRPPKPPSLSTSLDAPSTASKLPVGNPSPISQSPTSADVPTRPAPGLPPRPAWARKQSPSPAPAPDATSTADKPEAVSGALPATSSTAPIRRDTTSTVNSASSTSSSLSQQGLSSAPSRPSASPALPPRPRWTPPTSKSASEVSASARSRTMTANGGQTDAAADRAARKRYDRLFEQCFEAIKKQYGPTGGRLDGMIVVELWRRSRLEDAQLRKIWNDVSTAESRRAGGLDREEFGRGMAAIDAELRKRWRE